MRIQPLKGKSEAYNTVEIDILNASSFPTDRISYLIRVLNVEEIFPNGDPFSQAFKGQAGNYELHGFSEEALVDEKTLPIRFDLLNRHEPFIVSVIAWNKEAGMFKNHGLFDPMNGEYIDHFQTGELQEKTVEDLYTTLQEIRKYT
jgi:hypothetical protein